MSISRPSWVIAASLLSHLSAAQDNAAAVIPNPYGSGCCIIFRDRGSAEKPYLYSSVSVSGKSLLTGQSFTLQPLSKAQRFDGSQLPSAPNKRGALLALGQIPAAASGPCEVKITWRQRRSDLRETHNASSVDLPVFGIFQRQVSERKGSMFLVLPGEKLPDFVYESGNRVDPVDFVMKPLWLIGLTGQQGKTRTYSFNLGGKRVQVSLSQTLLENMALEPAEVFTPKGDWKSRSLYLFGNEIPVVYKPGGTPSRELMWHDQALRPRVFFRLWRNRYLGFREPFRLEGNTEVSLGEQPYNFYHPVVTVFDRTPLTTGVDDLWREGRYSLPIGEYLPPFMMTSGEWQFDRLLSRESFTQTLKSLSPAVRRRILKEHEDGRNANPYCKGLTPRQIAFLYGWPDEPKSAAKLAADVASGRTKAWDFYCQGNYYSVSVYFKNGKADRCDVGVSP